MQKRVLKIQLFVMLMITAQSVLAFDGTQLLKKADSLYDQKKYAESRELYYQLYQQGFHSPSTLLKMAFVHEGLGETGPALFFLSAYYRETEDIKALEKINNLAKAKDLTGFGLSDWDRLVVLIANKMTLALGAILVIIVFFIFITLYNARHGNQNAKIATGFTSVFFIGICLVLFNYIKLPNKGMVTQLSYVMDGPSAAANLVGLIPMGNQIEIMNETDIWVCVEWKDRPAYLRKSDLLLPR